MHARDTRNLESASRCTVRYLSGSTSSQCLAASGLTPDGRMFARSGNGSLPSLPGLVASRKTAARGINPGASSGWPTPYADPADPADPVRLAAASEEAPWPHHPSNLMTNPTLHPHTMKGNRARRGRCLSFGGGTTQSKTEAKVATVTKMAATVAPTRTVRSVATDVPMTTADGAREVWGGGAAGARRTLWGHYKYSTVSR